MKAAVLDQSGTIPRFDDFPNPKIENEQQLLVTIKAASIKRLDLLKASGKHYMKHGSFPTTIGVDGIGVTENGQRIYSMGVTGMMAEKAIVAKDRAIPVPNGLSDEIAAALPNALLGSDAALIYRAKIKKGDVVLVNGATGVTGTVAVQVAKYHGAGKVIAVGRNKEALNNLKEWGADETVSLEQNDASYINQLSDIHHHTPFDLIVDYLWGHPMELILTVLRNSKLLHHTKIVTIGEMAGPVITLSADILRSKSVEIIGSGIGSLTPQDINDYMKNCLPAMYQLAAEGGLKLDIETFSLKDISNAWVKASNSGKRIVVKV
jgi:NADPH:quinone reductase-like Zn-dependent oxidoreductase